MHAPERWPYGNSEDWWAWRDHLAHIQHPNIATLKRVRDCEDLAVLRGQVGAPPGVTPAKRLPPSVAGRAGWRRSTSPRAAITSSISRFPLRRAAGPGARQARLGSG